MIEIPHTIASPRNTMISSCASERQPAWRHRLPILSDGEIVLRELRAPDAPSLLAHLNRSAVLRYIDPCPSTVEGFRQFIRWTQNQRRRKRHVCFGIVPNGQTAAVGVIQMWPIERDFSTVEWGFALSDSHWGTGLFVRAARLFVDTLFADFGVLRLEARAVDANARGNGVLRKLGATCEGTLRNAFRKADSTMDHCMWSILANEWPLHNRAARRL